MLIIKIFMEGVILHTKSGKDLNLILKLARKMGISVRRLSREEIEDLCLAEAISEGRTGEYVNTKSFIDELRDVSKD